MSAVSTTYYDKTANSIAWEITGCEAIEDLTIYEKWVDYLEARGKITKAGVARVAAVLKKTKRSLEMKDATCQYGND